MPYQPIKRGVICPIVTPLKASGDINPDMIGPLVDFLIGKGVAGIYPLGSTGEGPLFTSDERKAVAAATVEAVAGRVPVIVHTGAMTTAETIELTRHAQSIGADAASVITPWYFMHSEAALEAHYRAVLEAAAGFPVWLYNLPKFANNNLSAALVTRLARDYENCVGLEGQQRRSADDVRGQSFARWALQHRDWAGQFDSGRAGAGAGLQRLRQQQSFSRDRGGIHEAFHAGDLAAAQRLQKQLKAASDVIGSAGWLTAVKGRLGRARLAGRRRAPADAARVGGSDPRLHRPAARAQGGFEPGVVPKGGTPRHPTPGPSPRHHYERGVKPIMQRTQ